jgi:hypothetical protein
MKRLMVSVAATAALLLTPAGANSAVAATGGSTHHGVSAECASPSHPLLARKDPYCTWVVAVCWATINFDDLSVGTLWKEDDVWGDAAEFVGGERHVYSYRHSKWGWVADADLAVLGCS